MSNTKINYLYRDAGNYKVFNEIIIKGEFTEEQIGEIISCLDEKEYFIPSEVGLPEKKFDEEDAEDDHPWFELSKKSFEKTNERYSQNITAYKLYKAFCNKKDKWLNSCNI